MCILFLLFDTTEFVLTIYFLHVGLSLAYKGSNMERSTVLQKKAAYWCQKGSCLCLLVFLIWVTMKTFRVQDRKVILELVEVNYASNQREEWKNYFWKWVNKKPHKDTKNCHSATRVAGVRRVQCFKQVRIGAREGGEEQENTYFGDKFHPTHI